MILHKKLFLSLSLFALGAMRAMQGPAFGQVALQIAREREVTQEDVCIGAFVSSVWHMHDASLENDDRAEAARTVKRTGSALASLDIFTLPREYLLLSNAQAAINCAVLAEKLAIPEDQLYINIADLVTMADNVLNNLPTATLSKLGHPHR